MNVIKRLWELPPQEVARKIRQRFRGRSASSVEDTLRSPKQMRPQRPYDFFSRYEAILARAAGWVPLEFRDRNIVEIGCGPMLGFGPIAIFLGCRSFTAIDPGLDIAVVHHSEIQEKFFLRVHKDLCGIYGDRMDFDSFAERLESRVRPVPCAILDAELAAGECDVVLSNSTLEHLDPLSESIGKLRSWCQLEARFLHLVDFGNHRATRSPFSGMYSVDPREYRRRHGSGINLVRPTEMLRVLQGAGFDATLQPYYSFPEFYDEPISPWWSSRFETDELFLKAAIYFGPGKAIE